MTNPPNNIRKQKSSREASLLSENTRELLGVGKDDWWCYIGWAFLAIGCFLDNDGAVIS